MLETLPSSPGPLSCSQVSTTHEDRAYIDENTVVRFLNE